MNLPPTLPPHDAATADAQALHALADGYYGLFDIATLRASPDNRKRFNEQALQELAASIKSMGVAQPILIRPVTPTADEPEIFEIVAGERRFRASKIAGMTTIPAMCRDLSNLDAAKIRILENLQREDPHPIEEAEGYQQLMLQHGYSADQLAEEIKKSRAYIYGRLKLCALTTEVRESFLEDKIPASTALLIARIPVPALQVKALGEIMHPYGGQSEALSYRRAVEHIQGRYMLDLATAVFKLEDAKLLGSAGACTKCPKRTGNQAELYPGVSADVCTDPDCFSEKRAAHHAATLVLANKKGIPVHEGADTQRFLSMRWRADGEMVFGDTSIQLFARNAPDTKNAGTVATYLKDKLPPAAAYLKYNDGTMLPMYERGAMQKALEDAGACESVEAHAARMSAAAAQPETQQAMSAAEKAREAAAAEQRAINAKAKRETTFRVELYKQLRMRAQNGFSLQSLREMTKLALSHHPLPDDLLGDVYDFDGSSDAAVAAHIDTAGLAEVQLLLIDLLVGETLSVSTWDLRNDEYLRDEFRAVAAMARHEGIDPDQVREELFPSPIDVTSMQYADLVDFIGKHPQRLAELTKIVLAHQRGELVGMLDRAAKEHGYVYKEGGFVLQQEQPKEVVAPVDVDATATQDMVAESAEPAAILETPPPADDGEDLAAQLDEIEAATSAAKKPAPKSSKSKPAAAAKKDTKKAAPAKPAKKPAAAATKEKATDPWPFPKSSTQPREVAPAPGSTEVGAA